ncbi:MAG: hypothetical protein IH604_02700 [Burkholderiales bacterium]|nr:hypothetical protein [Burkholderiales bacterium]
MSQTKSYWLDRKENVTKVYWAVWIVCGVLLLIDPLIHKHEAFGFAEWFGFFGFFGFFACVGLVLAAKMLRKILKRAEDYYER